MKSALYLNDCIRFLTLKILTNSFMVDILVISHFCHFTQLQRIYLYNIISHICTSISGTNTWKFIQKLLLAHLLSTRLGTHTQVYK